MEPAKKVVIIGGYGRIGIRIAELLLEHSRHRISLAGRDLIRSVRAARDLNARTFGKRVKGVEVNAALKVQLVRLLADHDLAVTAVPASGMNDKMAEAALETGVDCIDLNAGHGRLELSEQLDGRFRQAERTFITGAGLFHGSLPVMARYLAGYLDSVDTMTADGLSGTARGHDPRYGLTPPSVRRYSGPSLRSKVSVTGAGVSGGRRMRLKLTLGHRDPCLAVAMAAVPCILDVADGSIRRPGVHDMGSVLDPDRYLENLWDMGMTVSFQKWPGPELRVSPAAEMHPTRWNDLPVF